MMRRTFLLMAIVAVASTSSGCRLFPWWRQGAYCDPCMTATETCSPCIPCNPCDPCDPCGIPAITTGPPVQTYGPVTGP